jgi:glycosyltransferase involved in cell wall biosynthesis
LTDVPRDKQLRIVFFLETMALGGSEVQACDVGLRLARRGHKVSFACFSMKGPLAESVREVQTKVFPLRSLMSLEACVQLKAFVTYLRRERVDVVHAHDLYSNLFAVPAARLARVPVVVSSRRDLSNWSWYTPRRRGILRYVQERGTHVLANAEAIKRNLVEQDGFYPGGIAVIHNSIDIQRFQTPPSPRHKVIPGAPPGEKWIVLVGNMNSVYRHGSESFKGHLDLVRAATIVCAKAPYARFVLVGDGGVRGAIEEAAQQAGLTGKFSFLGLRRDIPELLSCCDIAVLPSHAEGLPNALLEYMAASLPIVATNVGGIPEVVEHDRTGLLVPPRSPDALAAAILRLIADEELATRLARGARRRAEEFSFDRQLCALETLYRSPSSHMRGRGASLRRLAFSKMMPDQR